MPGLVPGIKINCLYMSYQIKSQLKSFLSAIFKSYAQVFFSNNILFGGLLLLVSFFDFYAGLYGLVAVILTNITALLMGYNELKINSGSYAYNSLLVGLGIGLNFVPGWPSFLIVVFAAILTLIFTVVLDGFLGKYALPFLSLPFLWVIWIVILSSRALSALGLSQRDIYTLNKIYDLGGQYLINIYQWFQNIDLPVFLKTYFLSLGAIFFQYNILAGILIALGLLYHSRITFLLSILGFSVAFFFYKFLGVDITQYAYSSIGFNYILTAIAIGGYFLIPNKFSFLWVIILLPIVVLISISSTQILMYFQLPVYSLPFNLVVLSFLYFIKLRAKQSVLLQEVIVQLNSPEKNLYYYIQAKLRFKWLSYFPIYLPFLGKWTVSQAENGAYTHQGDWQYAWDFIMCDQNQLQYQGQGNYVQDYYCYGKPVVAPSDGIVVEVIDNVEDNTVGDANLLQNWGNSIVIKHLEYLYSQVSHLKKGSIKVQKGDIVKKGDTLALCGNSGRSPYPHLHFQLQATPFVGSPTISYPISHYIKHTKIPETPFELHSYDKPKLDETVSNMQTTSLLTQAFKFIPGQKIRYAYKGEINEWHIHTNYLNQTYIHCKVTNSYAYLFNDGQVFYFLSFYGNKKSALYHFYLALYQVPLGYYKQLALEDAFAPNLIFNKKQMFIHDLLAPFYTIHNASFNFKFIGIDDNLVPGKISMQSIIKLYTLGKIISAKTYHITVTKNGIEKITGPSFDWQIIKS